MQWNTLVTANIQLLVGEMMVVEVRVMVRVVEVVEVVVLRVVEVVEVVVVRVVEVVEVMVVRVVEVVEVVVAKNIDWRVALESGRHSSS